MTLQHAKRYASSKTRQLVLSLYIRPFLQFLLFWIVGLFPKQYPFWSRFFFSFFFLLIRLWSDYRTIFFLVQYKYCNRAVFIWCDRIGTTLLFNLKVVVLQPGQQRYVHLICLSTHYSQICSQYKVINIFLSIMATLVRRTNKGITQICPMYCVGLYRGPCFALYIVLCTVEINTFYVKVR